MRLTRGLVSLVLQASLWLATSTSAAPLTYFEGFDAEFATNRNVPFFANVGLSSPFGPLNGGCGEAGGTLNIRNKTICDPNPCPGCAAGLDFTNGGGSFVTFEFATPDGIPETSFVQFEVASFGSDGGQLFKSYSTDGTNFLPLGDASDANGIHFFSLPSGPATALFFRLQVGTSAGIFDGLHIRNVGVTIVPEPTTIALLACGLAGLATRNHRR